MIVGIEGIHTFRDFVMNDLTVMPRVRVNAIPGLRGKPDFDPPADKAMGKTGEIPRKADLGGKTITYEGDLIATGPLELMQLAEDMEFAFNTVDEDIMTVEPHPDDPTVGLPSRFFYARPVSVDTPAEYAEGGLGLSSRGWTGEFSVVLRLSDPRFYHSDAEVTIEDDVSQPGAGAGVPYTPGGWTDPPSSEYFEVACDNPGTADVEGSFRMYGPLRNPVLVNKTTDRFLRFKDLIIPDGQYVKVDFRLRTIKRSTGENVYTKLDPSSTWWDRGEVCLGPRQVTNVRLRAYGVEAGAKLQATFNPADYS